MAMTAEHQSVPDARRLRGWGWARRTDGRLTMLTAGLVLVGVLVGVVGTVDLTQRVTELAAVAEHDGPLTTRALDVYHSLADADATSANEFLAAASPALRQHFQDSVARAASALDSAALLAGSSPSTALAATLAVCSASTATAPIPVQLDVLARELPVYQPAFAALTRWWGARRVVALTAVTLVAGLASTVFAPLTAQLGQHLDWRHTYLTLAAVLAAITIPAHAIGLAGPWPTVPDDHSPHHTAAAPATVARSRAFILLRSR